MSQSTISDGPTWGRAYGPQVSKGLSSSTNPNSRVTSGPGFHHSGASSKGNRPRVSLGQTDLPNLPIRWWSLACGSSSTATWESLIGWLGWSYRSLLRLVKTGVTDLRLNYYRNWRSRSRRLPHCYYRKNGLQRRFSGYNNRVLAL